MCLLAPCANYTAVAALLYFRREFDKSASTSCFMELSTFGSPRLSLGSGLLTLPAPDEYCTSVVRLNSRVVRSFIRDCLLGPFPLLLRSVALLSLLSLFPSALSFFLAFVATLEQYPLLVLMFVRSRQRFSHSVQLVFCLCQVLQCPNCL